MLRSRASSRTRVPTQGRVPARRACDDRSRRSSVSRRRPSPRARIGAPRRSVACALAPGRALATLVEEISAPEAVRALALERVRACGRTGWGFVIRSAAVPGRTPGGSSSQHRGPGAHLLLGRRPADSCRRHPSGGDRPGAGVAPRSRDHHRVGRRTTDPPRKRSTSCASSCTCSCLPSSATFSTPVRSSSRSTGRRRLSWEFLSVPPTDGGGHEPLSVQLPLHVSSEPSTAPRPATPVARGKIRALVIGDPGDPTVGESLEGARVEALRVVEILSERDDVEVDARIGAPNVPREDR